jgi:hypothetical protein
MTVSVETNTVRYAGDGVSVAFTITFPFQETSHIRLFVDDVLTTSGFTITGGSPTGTLTFDTAPTNGADIFMRRVVPIVQDKAYPTNDTFPSASHEAALDKLTQIAQQLSRDVSVSLQLPESTSVSDFQKLPNPSAGKLIVWNGDEDGFVNSTKTLTEIEDAVDSFDAVTAGSGVLVSSGDTTVGFLEGKLTAGATITLTKSNAGANESLAITVASGSIDTDQLADEAVTAAKIEDETLTYAKAAANEFATAAQGVLADTAVQPADIAGIVSAGWELVDSADISTPVASVEFDDLEAYRDIMVLIDEVQASNSGAIRSIRAKDAGGLISGSVYSRADGAPTSQISTHSNGTADARSGRTIIYNFNTTDAVKPVINSNTVSSAGTNVGVKDNSVLTGVSIYPSVGATIGGTGAMVYLFGRV